MAHTSGTRGDSAKSAIKETIENKFQGVFARKMAESADDESLFGAIMRLLRKLPDDALSLGVSFAASEVRKISWGDEKTREMMAIAVTALGPSVAEWKRHHPDDDEAFEKEAQAHFQIWKSEHGHKGWKPATKIKAPHFGTVLDEFDSVKERVFLQAMAFALFERQGDHKHSKSLEGNATKMLYGAFEAARRAKKATERHLPDDKRLVDLMNDMRQLTIDGRKGGVRWTAAAEEFIRRLWDFYVFVLVTYYAEQKEFDSVDVLHAFQDVLDDLGSWAGIKKIVKIDAAAEKLKQLEHKADLAAGATLALVGLSIVYVLVLVALVVLNQHHKLPDFAIWSAFVMYGLAAVVLIVGICLKRIWQGAAIVLAMMVFPPLLALAFAFATLTNYVGLLIWSLPPILLMLWDVCNWRLYNIILNSGSFIASQVKDFLGGEEKAKEKLAPFKESIFLKRIGVTGAAAICSLWIIILIVQMWVGADLTSPLAWMQRGFAWAGLGAVTYAYVWSVTSLRKLDEFPEHLREKAKEAAIKDLDTIRTFRNVCIAAGILMTVGGGLVSFIGSDNLNKLSDAADRTGDTVVNAVEKSSKKSGASSSSKCERARAKLDCTGADANLRLCQTGCK